MITVGLTSEMALTCIGVVINVCEVTDAQVEAGRGQLAVN